MITSYVVVDLETTGLQPKTDRILEIGAIKVVENKVVDTFSTLVDPQMVISPYTTALTGITREMVEGKPHVHEAVDQFLDFCRELPLVGHNIIFDYSFLKHQAVNLGREFEKQALDTLKISRCAHPTLESRSLEAMCDCYQIQRTHAHRAFDDAKATLELLQHLQREFEEGHPDWFVEKPLIYKVKRQGPITSAQKRYLNDLMKYHTIERDVEIESLTKSEASRMIDRIIAEHGRIER